MSEQHEPQPSSDQTPSPKLSARAGRMDARRRQLLRGGLATAPALLALKSSPVLACNCKLPSGFSVSGNLSRSGGKNCTAPGSKPSVWKTKLTGSNYTGTSIPKSKQFNTLTVGSTTFQVNATYPTATMDTCLGKGNTNLQAMCCAVYLDALVTGGVNFPSPQMVADMWNKGVISSTGYPVPGGAGIVWKTTEVTNYFLYLTNQAV